MPPAFENATNESMIGGQAEKIKNIIDESDSFALLVNENAQEHELLSREALRAALQAMGKSVRALPEAPDEFKEKWSAILPPAASGSFVHGNSIRVPKNKLKIKEISYENGEDFFVFNLKSEGGRLDEENILIESEPAEIGAVFAIGPMGAEYAEKFKDEISVPPEDKIVLVNRNSLTAAEKTRDIIKNADESVFRRSGVLTLLLAALLLERISRCGGPADKTAEMERELLGMGADKKFVNGIMADSLPLDRLPVI